MYFVDKSRVDTFLSTLITSWQICRPIASRQTALHPAERDQSHSKTTQSTLFYSKHYKHHGYYFIYLLHLSNKSNNISELPTTQK